MMKGKDSIKVLIGSVIVVVTGVLFFSFERSGRTEGTSERGVEKGGANEAGRNSERGRDLPGTSREIIAMLESGDTILNGDGIKAAQEYLRKPVPAESAIDPAAEYFNTVIAILLAQKREIGELSTILLEKTQDEKSPLILMDYATQHLFHVWCSEKDLAFKKQIEARLQVMTEDRSSPLQAVSILTTVRFFPVHQDEVGPNGERLKSLNQRVGSEATINTLVLDRNRFVNHCQGTSIDEGSSETARASALHALLLLRESGSLPIVRSILTAPQADDQIVSAALAFIGTLGVPGTDDALMESIPRTSPAVSTAVTAALANLKSRGVKSSSISN